MNVESVAKRFACAHLPESNSVGSKLNNACMEMPPVVKSPKKKSDEKTEDSIGENKI